MNRRPTAALLTLFLSVGFILPALAAPSGRSSPPAGEINGEKISRETFDFAYKTTTIFLVSDRTLGTDAARREEAWRHLILLREADRRNVDVPREQVEAELKRLLAEKKIGYGSLNYFKWVKQTFGENHETFERRVRDLLKVRALVEKFRNPPPSGFTETDAKEKYRDQKRTMDAELVQFKERADAEKFLKSMTPRKWDEAKKKDAKFSKRTGAMPFEAHVDLWRLSRADAETLFAAKPGAVAGAFANADGWAAYRLMAKTDADMAAFTKETAKEYIAKLEAAHQAKHGLGALNTILANAALKDYDRDRIVAIETTQGTFEVRLFPDVAPKAVENFTRLAEKGYYDGTKFHRVIKGFMIQGGDPTATGSGGESIWGEDFEDEVRPDVGFDRPGLLAMANGGPDTNSSQFFVTLGPKPHLNMKHTIFGEVVKGYDVVEKIAAVPIEGDGQVVARPVEDQKIIGMSVKKWV